MWRRTDEALACIDDNVRSVGRPLPLSPICSERLIRLNRKTTPKYGKQPSRDSDGTPLRAKFGSGKRARERGWACVC